MHLHIRSTVLRKHRLRGLDQPLSNCRTVIEWMIAVFVLKLHECYLLELLELRPVILLGLGLIGLQHYLQFGQVNIGPGTNGVLLG